MSVPPAEPAGSEISGRDVLGTLLRRGLEAPHGFRGVLGGVQVQAHMEGHGYGWSLGRYLAFRPLRAALVDLGGERLEWGDPRRVARMKEARVQLRGLDGATLQIPAPRVDSSDDLEWFRIDGWVGDLLTKRTLEVVAAAFRALGPPSRDTE